MRSDYSYRQRLRAAVRARDRVRERERDRERGSKRDCRRDALAFAAQPCVSWSHRSDSNQRPTVYESLGALNAFKRLGGLLTNRVRSSASRS